MTITKDRTLWLVKAIILLSLVDALCTDIGIRLGWVTEANPIASTVYDWSILGFYGWKVLLPLALLLLYPHMTIRPLYQRLIQATAFLYVGINIYHLVWIAYGCYVFY